MIDIEGYISNKWHIFYDTINQLTLIFIGKGTYALTSISFYHFIRDLF